MDRSFGSDTFLEKDWERMALVDPLSGGSGSLWASEGYAPYAYDQRQSQSWGYSYDPANGMYGMSYDPYSGFTSKTIDALIDKFMFDPATGKYLHLNDFSSGWANSGGGFGGNVSQNPSFGQFNNDPTVFREIEAAASKYGVPANLLKVMIGRESSGDWSGANTGAVYLASRGERIVGYTGIMESTARSWGYNFDELVGNRALQIDAMANGLQRLYQQVGAQYGWDGVIAMYYSGDPSQAYTPGDSYQYGTTAEYVADVRSWWNQEDQWTQQNGGQLFQQGTPGMGTINNGDWAGVNKYDAFVAAASKQYGVPANLIKAIMRLESGGNPNAVSPQGATGLMQIMPFHVGGQQNLLLNPEFNILKSAEILRDNYDRHGSWEWAARAYLGIGGTDAYGTDHNMYWNRVNQYWKELDAGVSGMFGGEEGDRGPTTTISAIWGNAPGVVKTQGNMEVNDWVLDNTSSVLGGRASGAGMYDYAVRQFGRMGHPGVDYGMPIGTDLFTPVSGTVIVSGGSGYYLHGPSGNQQQTGELRIRLDNGHEIILGHMAGIHVTAGNRVTAGQYVGVSGTYGSGPHLHLEYRVPTTALAGGWDVVDPEEALRGAFAGHYSGRMVGAGIDRPFTFEEMLRLSAAGKPVSMGMTRMASPRTWNSFLQDAMQGRVRGESQGMTASGRPRSPMTSQWGRY